MELFVGFTWYSRRARLRHFESILKVVLFIGPPVPIILCPVVVICGNFLAGLGYGLVTPLAVTFKAIGKGRDNKRSYFCGYYCLYVLCHRSYSFL